MSLRAFWQSSYRTVTDRIEIYDTEFTGTAFGLTAGATPFSFSHQEVTSESNEGILNPYANRIQKGVLDFHFKAKTAPELSLHQDMLDTDSQRFKIVWKQNDEVFWQGYIDTRKREWSERPNYTATIRATDFRAIENIDYPLSDGRAKQIEIIADLLGYLNFDIPIETHTAWIVDGTLSTDDYLNQTYKDKYALRKYARTGDEADEPIPVLDALEKVTEGLIVRQIDGAFQLVQIPAFENPQSVWKFTYDSTGAKLSGAEVDLRQTLQTSIDNGDTVVKAGSGNDGYPAIRRTRVKYDHRTQVSGIQFPNRVDLSNTNTSEAFSQLFLSDGSQIINLRAVVEGYWPTEQDGKEPYFEWQIKAGKYYWDDSGSGVWTETITTNQTDLTPRGRLGSEGYLSLGGLSVQTNQTPQDADGQLEITLRTADSQDGFADVTYYRSIEFFIDNQIASENSTFIDYQLTQSQGQYRLQLSDSWFGDGPVDFARGSISRAVDGNYTTDDWARRGETLFKNYHHNLMRDFIDSQRSWTRRINANMFVGYDPTKIGVYDGSNYFYTGGRYANYKWSASLFEIAIDSQSDTFEDLPKFSEEGTTGSATAGTSSGGGGLDQSTADARYFRQANNLSEGDPSDLRTNIGLADSTADLDISSLITGDLRINEGKITSPVDYQLRNAGDTDYRNVSIANATIGQHALNLQTAEDLFISGQRELTFKGLDGVTVDPETQDLTEDRTWEIKVDIDDPLEFNLGNIGIKDHGLNQRGVLNTATQNIYGRKQFQSESQFTEDIFLDKGQRWDDVNSFIQTTTFQGTFAGSGARLQNVDGDWNLTVDNITARKRFTVYELMLQQLRAGRGNEIFRSGMEAFDVVEKIPYSPVQDISTPVQDIDDKAGVSHEIYQEDDMFVPFTELDLLRQQTFTGRSIKLIEATVIDVENGSTVVTDNTTPRFASISVEEGSDDPVIGDQFVALGNETDPDRQGFVGVFSEDEGAPFIRIADGIDDHSKFGSTDTLVAQYGKLDNVIDPDFPSLDGTQTNLYGTYVNSGFFNNVEVRGNITVLGGNAATKDYVDNAVGQGEGAVVIRSDTEPTERPDGSGLALGDIWIKTDEGDLPHTYNGTSWIRAYTVIDGGNLTTGSVTANKINIGSVTDIDTDAALVSDIITDYGELSGLPTLGDVSELNSITSTFISDGAVITAKIAAGAIVADKIASNAVTADKISVGSVTDIDSDAAIVSDIITEYGELNGLPTLGDVSELNSITSTFISNGAVITSKIAAGAVVADKIDVNDLNALEADIAGWEIIDRSITKLLPNKSFSRVHITSEPWGGDILPGAGVRWSSSENDGFRYVHVGMIHDLDSETFANEDYGFEVVDGDLNHLVRMGGGDFFITNADNDFKIDKSGFSVISDENFVVEKGYNLLDENDGSRIGSLWAQSITEGKTVVLESNTGNTLSLNGRGKLSLRSSNEIYLESGNDGIRLQNLPTSNPQVFGQLWRDGTLVRFSTG